MAKWLRIYTHGLGFKQHFLGDKPFTDWQKERILITTVGKIIFNEIMPVEFPYLNEPTDYNLTVQTQINTS